MSEQSKTPRTDKASLESCGGKLICVHATFASQLETELAEANTEILMLQNMNAQVNESLDCRNKELANAKKAICRLQEKIDEMEHDL